MSVVAQWSSGDLSILYIDSKCGGFGVLYVGSYLCVHSGYLSVCLSLSWLALTNVEGEIFSLGKSTKSLAVSDRLSVSCRALTAAVSTPTGTCTLQHHLQGFLLHAETGPFPLLVPIPSLPCLLRNKEETSCQIPGGYFRECWLALRCQS